MLGVGVMVDGSGATVCLLGVGVDARLVGMTAGVGVVLAQLLTLSVRMISKLHKLLDLSIIQGCNFGSELVNRHRVAAAVIVASNDIKVI